MTIQPAPLTFQERFARACDVATFTLDKGGPCYLLWEVDHVQAGQRVKLDGVFFTEEEARISADLLRGTLRGARASMCSYAPNWNPDPGREAAIRLEALQCREMLARRLGVHLAIPQEAV
ncbi:conserved protein of unknown function [Pseudomonas sp. JV551A1]|uniref:Uncharacterized protein n=1 Tax=Pseudomonas inefficax TaxID=2078786 RepID=A0AAQ1P7U9_9PSED|nr:conserved protein of unknown function [Pseudomonas sp. JV551A1]SPO59420.1 conserved protein of unknown function [Pseudomonas inefficax]